MIAWSLRRASADDADAVAGVWLAAWHGNAGSLPPAAHSDSDVRRWVRDVLLPTREVWVAEAGATAIAILALDEEWLDQLYVVPQRCSEGVGTALLELAKRLRPAGFGLWTFVSNEGAQRFYRRHGLVEVERTDGADNDEQAPDIHYVWRPD
ncbi:MAG: GNAT family N-acetyltransferase [Nocardioidaceae bacterium]